ncbi:MAG: hypothetical protein ACFCUJ_05725 [Thiotrichales bacterium]
MPRIHYKPTLSRNTLLLLLFTLVAVTLIVWYFRVPLQTLYFRDQVSTSSLTLNGIILALFFAGIVRLVLLLWRYRREERAIAIFLEHMHHESDRNEVDSDTLIARRYTAMLFSSKQGVTPNVGALAQIQVARESTRGSFARFVNNILILLGVFGTIVSLSLALFGATDLLHNAARNINGLELIVHGMSTALSTTMTAIVCYVIFGFFFHRLTSVQTRIVSAIEEITQEYLVPRFRVKAENLVNETALLVENLQKVVKQLELAQTEQHAREQIIAKALADHEHQMQELANQFVKTQRILLRGFRLGEKSE